MPRRVPNTRRRRWPRRPGATGRAAASPEPRAPSRPKGTAAAGVIWPCCAIPSDGMRHAAQEILRAFLLRRAQKLARPALLDDLAAVDEDHSIRHLACETHLVLAHDHRHAVVREHAHDGEHFAAQLGVEPRRGFVEEDCLGTHRQRPRDRHALLLATGKPVWVIMFLAGKADSRQQCARALARLGTRLAFYVNRTLDHVLERRAMRKKIESLKHHRNLFTDRHDVACIAIHALALDGDFAGGVGYETVHAAQQRRLAGTGGPDHADYFALAPLERDPVQYEVAPERLAHAADRDHFRPNFFSSRPTRRISGTHIARYQTATSVKISVFLNVEDAISLPWKERSATVMIEVCDVSFSSMMQVLP